jgi:hypothetical protein
LRKQRKQKRAAASNGFDEESIQFGWLAESIAFRLRRAQEASSQALVRPAGDDDLKLGSFALLKLIRENRRRQQGAGVSRNPRAGRVYIGIVTESVGQQTCALTIAKRMIAMPGDHRAPKRLLPDVGLIYGTV